MKKILSIIIALIMVLGASSSFAANIGEDDSRGVKFIKGAYITYNGTSKGGYGDGGVSFISDGVRNTFGARLGGEVVITFGSEVSFSGLRIWMSDNCVSGAEGTHFDAAMNGKDHRRAEVLLVKVSSDGTNWTEITNERQANNQYWYDDYTFGKNISAKYISLTSKKSNDGWGEWEIGEIALITDEDISSKVKADAGDAPNKIEAETSNNPDAYTYDSGWKLKASSTFYSMSVQRAFDGNVKTYWHSAYEVADGAVASQAPYPHYIDVDFGSNKEIAGVIYTPRTDNLAGIFNNCTVYVSDDGSLYKEIANATFSYSNGKTPQTIVFGEKVSTQYIRIESTDAGAGFGSAAEIQFLKKAPEKEVVKEAEKEEVKKAPVTEDGVSSDGTPFLDRTGWKASGKSFVSGQPSKILDGNTKTYWHSNYESADGVVTKRDPLPYTLEITLPEAKYISGISLHPRADGLDVGKILKINVYVKERENDEYFKLFEDMEFALESGSKAPREISFAANINVKKVKLEILDGAMSFGTLAEFNLWEAKAENENVSYEDFARVDAENRSYRVDTADFDISYIGECWSEYTANKMFDGSDVSLGSFFQTAELKKLDFPVVIVIDMAKERTFKEFQYFPRNTKDLHGLWLKFSVNISMDNENWETLIETTSLEKNLDTKKISFDEPVKARYMEIIVEEAVANRVSCAEVRLIQDKASHDREKEASTESSEKYELKIGSNMIKSEVNGKASEKALDVAPYIVDSSTMIPLRGLVEEMGAEISWDGATKKITLKTKDATIVLQIWNRRVFVTTKEFGEVRYTLLNFPVIKDSRTFIPVRFVSEQLGYNVAWDGATQTVTITK